MHLKSAVYIFSIRYARHFDGFLGEAIDNTVVTDAISAESFELALQGYANKRIIRDLTESFFKNIFERGIRLYKLARRI